MVEIYLNHTYMIIHVVGSCLHLYFDLIFEVHDVNVLTCPDVFFSIKLLTSLVRPRFRTRAMEHLLQLLEGGDARGGGEGHRVKITNHSEKFSTIF